MATSSLYKFLNFDCGKNVRGVREMFSPMTTRDRTIFNLRLISVKALTLLLILLIILYKLNNININIININKKIIIYN